MALAITPSTMSRPAPFAIENGDGRGAFVLLCDHASHHIPAEYAGLGLADSDRLRHIGWDIGALDLSRELSQRLDAPLVYATQSRLLYDVNRSADAHDAIATASEDIAIPGNRDLSAAERDDRRRWIYEPYHAAIERLVRERLRSGRRTAVIAVHSFTPVYRGVARPWRIGVLSHRDRRLADALLVALRTEWGLVDDMIGDMIGDNQPYAPTDGVYHTLERHAEAHGLLCAMLEIRNDLIQDGMGRTAWADRLAPLLRDVFETAAATSTSGALPPPST
jgi:predicted N-formylglutamate amidohydrolase